MSRFPGVVRVELRLALSDAMTKELAREAADRGLSLARHVEDLLRARYNARHGKPYIAHLWTPAVPETGAQDVQEPDPPPPPAVRNTAAFWLNRTDD